MARRHDAAARSIGARPAPRWRRRVVALLVGLVVVLVADQLLNALVLGDGWVLGVRVAPFDPPVFSSRQVEVLGRLQREVEAGVPPTRPIRFDRELGWCHAPESGAGEHRFDWAAARLGRAPLARERAAGVRRILAYGCSFTYGTEVEAVEAWPARLDELDARLEVANLGVPGYGVDQAMLRWRRERRDLPADEVWLGILPAAAVRTVNVYRPVLGRWSPTVSFKPRFELGQRGELQLVPQPARDLADVVRLASDAAAFLGAVGTHDDHVERLRAAYVPRGTHWTHHTAVGRVVLTLLDRWRPDPLDRLADQKDEVQRLTVAIVRAMAREVDEAGARFAVLVLPSADDLRDRAARGGAAWAGLVAAWRAEGIEVVDLSDALVAGGAPDAAELWMPGGHYSPRAHRIVAAALCEIVQSRRS